MSVLKFRVMYEEDDTIFRDIDIKTIHTLGDLEAIIHSSYNLPTSGNGSFFMSNDNWQKGRVVYPMVLKEQKKGKARAETVPTIVSFLDDPHQHFIYEYRGQQDFVFLIELITVGGKEDYKTSYPVCVRSQGPSPFKKEDLTVHFTKHAVPVAQQDEADEEEEENEEAEKEKSSVFAESVEETDVEIEAEDISSIEGEEHDLMEGDAIKEEDEEEAVDDDFGSGDDFNPEDLEATDDFEEDELR